MKQPTKTEVEAVLQEMARCGILLIKGVDPTTKETLYGVNLESTKDCKTCPKHSICPPYTKVY